MTYGRSLPGDCTAATQPWRYTLISGVIPALPLILIRPFLPESPAWQQKKAAGTLRRPSRRRGAVHARAAPHDDRHDDDVRVRVRRGVRRDPADAAHRARPRRGARAAARRSSSRPPAACRRTRRSAASPAASLLALLAHPHRVAPQAAARVPDPGPDRAAVRVLLRRRRTVSSWRSGACSSRASSRSAQFSFWGNYLPRVYPTHLRGTGEGFAANIGGRMIGTGFAFVTTQLTNVHAGRRRRRRASPTRRRSSVSVSISPDSSPAGSCRSRRERRCRNRKSERHKGRRQKAEQKEPGKKAIGRDGVDDRAFEPPLRTLSGSAEGARNRAGRRRAAVSFLSASSALRRSRLQPALAQAAIAYRHMPDLGGHREPRPDSTNTAWREPAFRGYADYMETPEFAAAIDALLKEAANAGPPSCARSCVGRTVIADSSATT